MARKIDVEELRRLGVPEKAIQEAIRREKRGLLDIRPSADLSERIMARCKKIIEEQQKKKK